MKEIFPKLNVPIISIQFLLRVLLSPFIGFYVFILLFGSFCVIPIIPLIMIISLYGLLSIPFNKLFTIATGKEITNIEPIILINDGYILNNILGITIYLWAIPMAMIRFILIGESIDIE